VTVTKTPSASIVLPIHNQGDHLERIVRDYNKALAAQSVDHEFVLVPNACTDRSVAVAERLATELPSVRVVVRRETGWGGAVKAGLAASTGDLVCYTNLARTTPEILLLMLLYARVYPSVVVKANRRVRDSRRRRLGSLLYNLECRALFDLSVWDINGTPKVFPRSFDKLLSLTRDDDLIDAEFNVVCQREGYPVVEVPILATVRHGGKSTTGYQSALRMYIGAYQLARSLRNSA
jgi:glycosyltransferase involved in cell wall biosynthesis